MSWPTSGLLCAAALIAASSAARAEDTAESAAMRFLAAYRKLHAAGLSGLPDSTQLRALAPYLTPGLAKRFEAAMRERRRCSKKFPDDKPPWAEGDMFSSSFEGYTSFSIAPGSATGGEVPVAFEYREGKNRIEWRDALVLNNAGGRWRVDNVLYRATFQFTSGFGSDLRSSLQAIPACGK
jgi:hypothetical protein